MTRYHETSAATAQNVEVGKSLKSLKMIVIGVCVCILRVCKHPFPTSLGPLADKEDMEAPQGLRTLPDPGSLSGDRSPGIKAGTYRGPDASLALVEAKGTCLTATVSLSSLPMSTSSFFPCIFLIFFRFPIVSPGLSLQMTTSLDRIGKRTQLMAAASLKSEECRCLLAYAPTMIRVTSFQKLGGHFFASDSFDSKGFADNA